MSDISKDGGPAFPRGPFRYGLDGRILYEQKDQCDPGMSLRDWLAGMALQGILTWDGVSRKEDETHEGAASRVAYQYADAMIAERSKQS